MLSGWQAIVASQDDGSFQIAVPPGKGHLLVFGPTGDYVLGEIGFDRLVSRSARRLHRYYAHAIIPYEVKAGDPPHEVAAAPAARRDDQGRGSRDPRARRSPTASSSPRSTSSRSARSGAAISCPDPRRPLRAARPRSRGVRSHLFLDPEHEWGATVEVSGKQAGEDLTIRLQPCGRAKARFVGPDGKPVVQHRPHVRDRRHARPEPDSAATRRSRPS